MEEGLKYVDSIRKKDARKGFKLDILGHGKPGGREISEGNSLFQQGETAPISDIAKSIFESQLGAELMSAEGVLDTRLTSCHSAEEEKIIGHDKNIKWQSSAQQLATHLGEYFSEDGVVVKGYRGKVATVSEGTQYDVFVENNKGELERKKRGDVKENFYPQKKEHIYGEFED